MRTILIADEDVAARTLVGFMFLDMDYRVVATSSGVDAISKAKEIKPDIVLVDVSLFDKDGYEVSREIKNNLLLKDTPVILLTSSLGTFDETKAVEVRADDFILKPLESEELTKKVEFLISQNKGGVGFLINQSKERKIRFVDVTPVLLVIFMFTAPLLYQSIDANLPKVESKLKRLYAQSKDLRNVNLPKIELKPMPAAEVKGRDVKKPEPVTEPVLPSELKPGKEEVYRKEGIEAPQLEKREAPEELKKVEVKKEEHLRVKKEEPKKLIKVETKKKEATKNNIAVASTLIEPGGKYTVQIGAFQKEEEAKKIAESLRSKGYPVLIKTEEIPGKGTWHRVRIGTFKTRREAKLYRNNLKGREPLIKKVIVVEEEKPEKKEMAEVSFSEKGKGIQKGSNYLTGIKITDWSLYVASGVPTIHHVTIENTNDIAYKDIKVRAHYYSQSYSNMGTTQIDEVTGILPVTLSSRSKKTYLERGATLKIDSNSTYGMYVGARDIEVLGAIPVPNLPNISQTNKPNPE